MIEQDVVVTTRHGLMPAYVAAPDGPGSWPGIIFYMDAPGMREELRAMARRIAKHGYVCLLPDMYYRMGHLRFDVPRRDEAMTKAIFAVMAHLTNDMVLEDTGGLIAWLDGCDRVKPGPVGCVGHCMSGRHITTVAARFSSRIAAAASLYGVGIVTDAEASPHRMLGDVKAELYYAFAETDAHVPDNVIPDLKDALKAAGTRHLVETFAGTQHGFCFPERVTYHPVAAEATWARILDMWQRNLG